MIRALATLFRLEERPAAIADHPLVQPGGVAGIAQVEPRDAHPAALCDSEQPAHRYPAAGALGPQSVWIEALDRLGGPEVGLLTSAMVEVMREIGRDDDQRLGPAPDRVEHGGNRLRSPATIGTRANSPSATWRNGK